MVKVYAVWNGYGAENENTDGLTLLFAHMDEDKANNYLDRVVAKKKGEWSLRHTIFNAETLGLAYDEYYVEAIYVEED
jgi:hypothetical protein